MRQGRRSRPRTSPILVTEYLLAYRFQQGEEFVTALTLRTESRARSGPGRGESASERQFVIRTRVLERTLHGAALEMTVEKTAADGVPPLSAGQQHVVRVTDLGQVVGVPPDEVMPGAWYILPSGPIRVGQRWRAQARPYQFPTEVAVFYTLEKVQGRRAVIQWECPTVTCPESTGHREYRAWGAYHMDLDNGRLAEARSVTRTRRIGPGWETDAITQLDLQDVTASA